MKSNDRSSYPAQSAGPPNAPGYTALRIAAEWASAVRGEPLYLAYDAGTGHVGVVDKSAAEMTLETSAGRRRPQVLEVEITVPRDGGDSTPLTLPGQGVSALFWGESAVEKFLVPYYASVAADDAAAFLSRLLTAWYGYPASVVQVCALAYLCGARAPEPGTRLSRDGTVGIIFVERDGGHLKMLALDEFTARYSLGMPRSAFVQPVPSPTVPMAGWKVTQGLENVVARDVAEFVSGMRGHLVAFQAEGSTLVPELYGPSVPQTQAAAGRFVMAAVAESVRADRPYPRSIRIRVRPLQGKEHWHHVVRADSHPTTTPDSMFWSDGAVEKLMLPYYASVKGRAAPYFLEVLMGRWDGTIPPNDTCPDVAASMRARLGADGDSPSPVSAAAEEDDTPVYTVTHLPRSEYATTRGEALEGRIVLLSAGPDGTAMYTLRGDAAGGKAPRQRSVAGGTAAAKSSRKTTSRAT